MVTAFQQRVYEKLKDVPAGKVTTYCDLAHAIGSKAYRAVGNAMHKNPYALVVPCHRVVNSDGSLGGFAWGAKKKIALLEQEGVHAVDGKIYNFAFLCHVFRD